MKAKQYLTEMGVTAFVTFVVAAGVTFLYSLLVYGSGAVDWETAADLAIVLGIVLPLALASSQKHTRAAD